LWRGLATGTIDIVTSEHAPGTRDEKEVGWKNIWDSWAGVPSIETMIPVLVSEGVHKGRLSLERLCSVMCEKPAKIFGLYPRKGAIAVGSDADLTIIDLKQEKRVRSDLLHYKCGWTPYEGAIFRGWPTMTTVRGEAIMENGNIVGGSGFGNFIAMRTSG